MKIYYSNLIQSAKTVITASSQQTGFPVSNVANDLKTLVWMTGGILGTEWALFDLGSPQNITDCILFNSTCQGDTVTIEGNSSSDFSSPAFSQSMTLDAFSTLYANFSVQNYRYWRVTIETVVNGVDEPAVRTIGNIYLGTSYQLAQDLDYSEGYKVTRNDLSQTQVTYGGQEYSQDRNQFRTVENIFTMYPQSQYAAFDTWEQAVGTHKPFYINYAPNIAPADPLLNEIIYAKLESLFEQDMLGYDSINASGYFWSTDLTVREQL